MYSDTAYILFQKPNIDSSSTEGLKPDIKGDVLFRNISFRYPSRPKVMVSVTIKQHYKTVSLSVKNNNATHHYNDYILRE